MIVSIQTEDVSVLLGHGLISETGKVGGGCQSGLRLPSNFWRERPSQKTNSIHEYEQMLQGSTAINICFTARNPQSVHGLT
jgi:hypothetical protein